MKTIEDLTGSHLPAALPLWPDVAGILGVGQNRACELAGAGELPFPAWKLGNRWMVPTAHLLRHLGITPPGDREPAPGAGAGLLESALDGAYVIVPVAALRRALGLGGDAEGGAQPPTPLRETA